MREVIPKMAKILLEPGFHDSVMRGAEALCAVAVPNYGPTGRTTIAEQKYDLPLVANSGRKILNQAKRLHQQIGQLRIRKRLPLFGRTLRKRDGSGHEARQQNHQHFFHSFSP